MHEQTDSLYRAITEAAPLAALGAMGGLIRAINIRPFSWTDLFTRTATGGFVGLLAHLYLQTTEYPPLMQAGICGAAGVLSLDLITAVRIRAFYEITGTKPEDKNDNGNQQDD
ncbi:MAG: phage holin family protein [Cloacibacillus sp.]